MARQKNRRKTLAPGIRYREHATRKHGVRRDRYLILRYSTGGRQIEEGLGWASGGWTLQRAQEELGKLREAHRTGEGDATMRAKRARAEAARREAEEREKKEKSVADLWDLYVSEVCVNNRPRTIAEKTRMWKARIEPAIGAMKLKDVAEDDVAAIVNAPLRRDATRKVVGGKGEAGNLYRLLHHLFRWALAKGMRPRALGNPLETVVHPKVPRRERLLTGGEIGAILKALAAAEEPQIVAVIRAAILTGARISELLNLRWEHVRRDEMELHLPDTKTGFSRRALSAETLAVFDSLGRRPGCPYVFRSVASPKEPLSYYTAQKAFARIVEKAGVRNCTFHTLRHWFATMTANSVSNPRVGMALTGHKSHEAYLRYVHGDKEQASALAEQLATLATNLGKAKSNVETAAA